MRKSQNIRTHRQKGRILWALPGMSYFLRLGQIRDVWSPELSFAGHGDKLFKTSKTENGS